MARKSNKQIKGQGQLFNPDDPSVVSSRQFEPVNHIVEGLKRYSEEAGITYPSDLPVHNIQVNHIRGHLTNLEYRKSMNNPKDAPGIKESYDAAEQHIRKQYEFMTRPEHLGGMGITHEIVREDPYPDVQSLAEDVRKNKRIKTFATASTQEGLLQESTNQAFSNETNDMFRAIHDALGHLPTGRGFSRHGEEAAFQFHKRFFPPEAHAALTAELRGQNSYLNYGPENEFPDIGGKMVGMPKWTSEDGPVRPKRKKKTKPQGEQLSLDLGM